MPGSREDVEDVWRQFVPRKRADELLEQPAAVVRALAQYDRASLVEAADLLVRTTGGLDPERWLTKVRLGSAGAPRPQGQNQRMVPASFDPFASDAPSRRPATGTDGNHPQTADGPARRAAIWRTSPESGRP